MISVVFEVVAIGGRHRARLRKTIIMPFVQVGMVVKVIDDDEFDGNWIKVDAIYFDPSIPGEVTVNPDAFEFDEDVFDKELSGLVKDGFEIVNRRDATSSKAT